MKLRVAVISESFLPTTNGVTNSVVKILESLREQGHDAILIAPSRLEPEFEGFPVIRTNFFYFRGFPVGLPLLNMTSILRSYKPDLIHVASPFWLGNQALRVAKRLRIPSVAVYQTDVAGYAARYGLRLLGGFGKWLTAQILKKATLVLAPTTVMRQNLISLGLKRVSIWGRGVDSVAFNPKNRTLPSTKKFRNGLARDEEIVIGFVGRLAPEKQIHRFGELFGLPNVKFLIVGEGTERHNLERLFFKQPVKFTGELKGLALANAYAAMDIFMHCGTEETFGQTIQEAQATGLPVVAPAVGGPLGLIDSGKNGILVDPTEPDAYLVAIRNLIKKPELRAELGKNARLSVVNKSWQQNNAKLFDYYAELLGHRVG